MPCDTTGVTTIPVDSNGNYSLPSGYLAVSGQEILPSQHNPPLQDIAAALSQVVYRSGVAPLNGNLSAAGFKITGAGEGSADGDYVTMSQLTAVIASVTAGTMPTGSVAGFRMTSPPTGWVKENGGTIGNIASGATTRANADTQSLFVLLWTQFDQTKLPIQDSAGAVTTRGASAAADFAAAKRMPLFDARSRFPRGADDGLGYDATITVGLAQADEIKGHTHTGETNIDGTHGHDVQLWIGSGGSHNTGGGSGFAGNAPAGDVTGGAHKHAFTTASTGGTETRPRALAELRCIKL